MTSQDIFLSVDIGGTFADVVATGPEGWLQIAKIPSTRQDASKVIDEIFETLLPSWNVSAERVHTFIHGTTVATNAILERKGARLGLLTTQGFEDVLEIGRQSRREIYDLVQRPQTPGFLCPAHMRRGVAEFTNPRGEVEVELDMEALAACVDDLVAEGAEAIAVSFLFSFLNPRNEERAADYIARRHPGIAVSLSSQVDPSFREYERSCVTAFDAYIKPVLQRYLGSIEQRLQQAGIRQPMQIMQSRGGTCSAAIAQSRPVRLFLSGPAAGVIGASLAGRTAGQRNIITVDIGGTSSDIALIIDHEPGVRPDGWVDGFRIRVPMIDVNAVGAGGGSIAWIDAGGGLRVGPDSAGAEPGPACYGRGGDRPTVTDASVVLGYLNPDNFAGRTLKLHPELARQAIETHIAAPLGMSVEQAALGIHHIANVQMAEGIRLVSIKRGIDPRSFSLVPFGGAGPMHAMALAAELDIDTIVFPRYPGVLSALGLMSAMIEHEITATYIRRLAELDMAELKGEFRKLLAACRALMQQEPADPATLETSYSMDMCYVGQAHYVEVPFQPEGGVHPDQLAQAFAQRYQQIYGHHTSAALQIVNLRVRERAHNLARPPAIEAAGPASASSPPGSRPYMSARTDGYMDAAVYERQSLEPGRRIQGPAIVEQADTTILIDPGWTATTDAHGQLIATTGRVK